MVQASTIWQGYHQQLGPCLAPDFFLRKMASGSITASISSSSWGGWAPLLLAYSFSVYSFHPFLTPYWSNSSFPCLFLMLLGAVNGYENLLRKAANILEKGYHCHLVAIRSKWLPRNWLEWLVQQRSCRLGDIPNLCTSLSWNRIYYCICWTL